MCKYCRQFSTLKYNIHSIYYLKDKSFNLANCQNACFYKYHGYITEEIKNRMKI